MRFLFLLIIPALTFCHRPYDYAAFVADKLSQDAMLGREAGTPKAHETAEWIRSEYIRMGLSPALPTGYIQEFQFHAGVEAQKSDLAIGSETIDGIALPLSLPGTAEGELAFGGYCIDSAQHQVDDFAGIDVRGKIVLCLRYAPGADENQKFARAMTFQSKWQALAKRGAAGIVFLSPEGAEPASPGDLPAGRAAGPVSIFVPTPALARILPWLPETESLMREGKTGHAKGNLCEAGKDCRATVRIAYTQKQKTGYNVAAFLLPYVPGQKFAILGAHFDHLGRGNFSSMGGRGRIHNGADDNASGTAAVMSAAKHWKRDLARGKKTLPPNTNVLFLNFDAEERGLYGSIAFANKSGLPMEDARVMVNLDMVGRFRIEKGMTVQGRDTADDRFKDILVSSFHETFGEKAKLKLISGGAGPSDHSSFYMKGVPVAFLFTGYHAQYHKPEDDFGLLNVEGIEHSSRYATLIASNVLGLEKPLEFKRAAKEDEEGRQFDFRLRLGIIPGSYESGEDGLTVGGVHKGAPVEQTGIREGDRIVSIGGQKIRDIHDLMQFLSNASADRSYRIIFMRGSQKMEADTKLMTQ